MATAPGSGQRIGSIYYDVTLNTGGLIQGQREVRGQLDSTSRQLDSFSARLSQVAGAIAGLSAASYLIAQSDAYTKFTAQLRLATTGSAEFSAALEDVRRISSGAQQDISAMGVLYAKITNGTRELGISQRNVAGIAEVVGLSLKVSGATAAEASSAMLQLSQSFASGRLNGEEFNAVSEAAPRLMQALAEGIGAPVGALKQMAEEGKLTSAVLADALPRSLDVLREEAKSIQTVSGAMQVLKNQVMEFIGTQAAASGSVSALTSAIGMLSENLGTLSAAAVGFAATKLSQLLSGMAVAAVNSAKTAIGYAQALNVQRASAIAAAEAEVAAAAAAAALTAARVAELRAAVLSAEGNVALAITVNGLIPAQARATAATEALALAQTKLTAAMTATTGAAGIASRALGFLGGPIGIITTLLGLGVTAWMLWGNQASESAKQVEKTVFETSAAIIESLDAQIRKIDQRNAALNYKPGIETNEQAEAIGALQQKIDKLESLKSNSQQEEAVRLTELNKLLAARGQIEQRTAMLASKTQEEKDRKAKAAAGAGAQEILQRQSGIPKSYMTDLKTLKDALDTGAIPFDVYTDAVKRLATETYKASTAGKEAGFGKEPKSGGGTKAAAGISKSELAGDLDTIRQASQAVLDEYSNAEKIMEARRTANLISEQEYYAAKLGFMRANSATQEAALQAEIDRMQREKLTGKEKIDNDRKIAGTQAQLAKVRADTVANIEVLNIQEAASADKLARSYEDAARAAQSYINTIRQQSERELAGIGMGDQVRTQNDRRSQRDDQFQSRRDSLDGQRRAGDITAEDYEKFLAIERDAHQRALAEDEIYWQAKLQKQKDWVLGANEVLVGYADAAANAFSNTETVVSNALKGMEDALVSFVTTGKLDFKGFADSVVADITRIIIKQQIANAMAGMMGGSGGGASSFIGDVFGSLMGARQYGGPVSAGGMYRVNEKGRPEMFTAGNGKQYMMPTASGKVTPADKVGGSKGGGNTVIVNVNQSFAPGTSRATTLQAAADARRQLEVAGRNL